MSEFIMPVFSEHVFFLFLHDSSTVISISRQDIRRNSPIKRVCAASKFTIFNQLNNQRYASSTSSHFLGQTSHKGPRKLNIAT